MGITRKCLVLVLLLISTVTFSQTVYDYMDEFIMDARIYNASLIRSQPAIIEVSTDIWTYNVIGETIYVDAFTHFVDRTIYFDTRSTTYNYNLKVLVYHELGHWYLGRGHTYDLSIMNYNIWDVGWDGLAPKEQTYFIKELFK